MIRNRETPGCKSHIMWPTCTSSTCIHHATITSLAAFHLCTISSYTMVMLSRTVHRSCKSWDTWRYRRQQSKSHLQTGRALARWVQQPNRSRRQVCRAEGGSARSLHRSSEYEVRFGHSQLFACSCSRFFAQTRQFALDLCHPGVPRCPQGLGCAVPQNTGQGDAQRLESGFYFMAR